MINGFINLYKERDISSNKALSILKNVLIQNNITTKIGHFGTLDPIADGVLPVALGRATRLFDYFTDKVKTYKAIFKFGVETDTLDRTGNILYSGRDDVEIEEIENIIPSLCGEIDQIPPLYSAKNVSGDRAYKLARKGVSFELPPKKVKIYSIKLLEKLQKGVFSFDIRCGGGTYIRSIVRDMAYKLGTYGIMEELTRTSSGIFDIDHSANIDKIRDNPLDFIYPLEYILKDFGEIRLNSDDYRLISTGRSAKIDFENGLYKVYTDDGTFMGIGSVEAFSLNMKTWLM